jgi:hypothetical protein
MAQVTPEIRRAYGLTAELVPTDILAKIPQSELVDRLEYAQSLVKKQASADPRERRELAERARAMLRAQPRNVTEQAVAATITKGSAISDGASTGAVQAARRLLEEHPPAPRRKAARPVAKSIGGAAKDDKAPLLAVYDRLGNITGVIDPAALIRVSDDPAAVAKALKTERRR